MRRTNVQHGQRRPLQRSMLLPATLVALLVPVAAILAFSLR